MLKFIFKISTSLLLLVLLTPSVVLAMHVEPVFMNDGPGGNVTCAEVGDYQFSSDRFDDGDQYAGSFDPITWSTIDDKLVSWNGIHGGLAVILKGGPGANVYEYDSSIVSDTGLQSPLNNGGQVPGLSNITFCWNPAEVDPSPAQWCSPGYWRQAHHLDQWMIFDPDDNYKESFNYSPDEDESEPYEAYFVPFSLSKLGQKQSDISNPTLLQVLEKPQWYGGAMFNAVGDLLSAAHPEVNFTGERVEDSCPLN